ncbi:MAG: sigma 54-interacting transcriptional regulator [Desulfobacterales bacterium]|nr:sigma 54-interacting transcriptional regulator [Desulfobacterales bacterium]
MEKKQILDGPFAELLLQSMAEGVFTLNRRGEITTWNPSMERITGYRANEVLGKACSILSFNRCITRSCPSGFLDCGIFRKGTGTPKECSLRHKDGHDVPVVKNARVIKSSDGEAMGVVETLMDLTELKKARQLAEEAARRLGEKHRFENMVGKSDAMVQVFSTIRSAALSDATILIQGESGTGKELVAAAIHASGYRAERPLVTVNCTALPESLLESELFGHVRGAFTGAIRDRIGRFEEAQGGTLFLDEIAELSPLIQVKLLRVLQEKEIERVGESKKRKVDIRVIAATNRDLYKRVREGFFREDLYYRLKVFPIQLPPLRKRREDIPLLVAHFIRAQNEKEGKKIRGVSPESMKIFLDHPWPGNVRELENAIEHAFVLCTGEEIGVSDLPLELRRGPMNDAAAHPWDKDSQKAAKPNREELLHLLDACGWNKAEAGRRMGLSRTAIWKYMKRWGIPLRRT